MYYFTQCLRWGIQEQLSWLGVSHAVIGKLPAKVPVTWKLDWASRTHFWGGPLTQLTSQCWLLAGGLSSSSHGPPCRALWVSPQYGDLLSQMFITGHEYTCLHKVEMCSFIYKKFQGRWYVTDIVVQLSHQVLRIFLSFCPLSLLEEVKVDSFFNMATRGPTISPQSKRK